MIAILLVDDHAVVREGYARLLSLEADLCVRAQASDAGSAYATLIDQHIDVAIVDINLGATSGMEAIRRMKARQPSLRVLVFSMYDNASVVTQALRAGAQGYLSKTTEPAEMIDAVRRVYRSERVLSADVAQALANEAIDGQALVNRLTPREFEVLRFSVRGCGVTSVAALLHVSEKTVFNHMSIIRQKLGTVSDFQLLQLAMRHGLLDQNTMAVAG